MSKLRNISLVIEYDGAGYHGWQCQPRVATLQETIQAGIGKILNHAVKVYAAGRTDAGVHALGQVINFFTEKTIDLASLMKALNSILPADIRIKRACEVDQSFHARYSAKSKSYVYCIYNARYHSPFQMRYAWHIPYALNVPAMNEAVRQIIGTHDFSSFKKKNEAYKRHEREVLKAWVRRRGAFIYTLIEATGFLRYMVRNIVGTLVLVGEARISENDFRVILDSRDRVNAGATAPPHGLFLRRIRY
ncbi:MAG TPA: tRNA pseudouridine(38-40) synthase TruA [Syntrophorhabdaceae bacterium]|nr:tRNA pseudouridine(38-40) synthase TruA [Syntrophorhabdaceae bacterium]